MGLTHVILITGALAIGIGLFAQRKGTPKHKRWGRIFVAAVLVSDIIVLGIYEDSATIGVFHVLAVVSFVSLAAAVACVWVHRSGVGLRIAHGHVMLWSFGGMIAAGLGQGATLIGFSPWPAILATFLVIAGFAVRLDFRAMLTPG